MSVYRKFDKNDILFSTIHTRPRVSVKYGQNGWEGSTGVSASLSLYGGIRGRRDVRSVDFQSSGISIFPLDPIDTHSIDKVIFVSGSYPSTGSIRFVRCRDLDVASTSVTQLDWYQEHFRPIELLFRYYQRFDSNYFLGSYDFYTPLLISDPLSASPRPNTGPYFVFSGTFDHRPVLSPSASFSVTAWVKPIPRTTSSLSANAPTIMSQKGWSVIVDTDSTLAFRTLSGTVSSSASLSLGEWNHVGVVVSGGINVEFYLNGQLRSSGSCSGTLTSVTGSEPLLVGSSVSVSGTHFAGFNGFIFETQVWGKVLTQQEISRYMSGTMSVSSSTDLYHYARFNDGPYSTYHGFSSGSGAFDYSSGAHHGRSIPWSVPNQVHWQPNDHETFVPKLSRTNLDLAEIKAFHVPSMFYGRQIDPGSVRITDGVYNDRRIVRVIQDDSRGSLYISGSMTRPISGEEYTGERRRKVGNVFYTEGLIVITDPALFDLFESSSTYWNTSVAGSGVFGDLISLDFNGQGRIDTKTFNCRLSTVQANASNNPTFSRLDDMGTEATDDDRMVFLRDDGTTYITAVGIYNEERQLVAVAKFAQPIRKREKDKENLRLKIDF